MGGVQLAIVALFTVTEDLVFSRRVLRQVKSSGRRRWLIPIFGSGGGRGAVYVLMQMALLIAVGLMLTPSQSELRWLLAICCYICFFTGVPAYIGRRWMPARARPANLRVATFVLFPVVLLLPDILYYIVMGREFFNLDYSSRHLVNPFRTLANWSIVETNQWYMPAFLIGLIGLISYLGLIKMSARVNDDAGVAH
jgi:hypothetical protein